MSLETSACLPELNMYIRDGVILRVVPESALLDHLTSLGPYSTRQTATCGTCGGLTFRGFLVNIPLGQSRYYVWGAWGALLSRLSMLLCDYDEPITKSSKFADAL